MRHVGVAQLHHPGFSWLGHGGGASRDGSGCSDPAGLPGWPTVSVRGGCAAAGAECAACAAPSLQSGTSTLGVGSTAWPVPAPAATSAEPGAEFEWRSPRSNCAESTRVGTTGCTATSTR